jgi:hypothetical protein
MKRENEHDWSTIISDQELTGLSLEWRSFEISTNRRKKSKFKFIVAEEDGLRFYREIDRFYPSVVAS